MHWHAKWLVTELSQSRENWILVLDAKSKGSYSLQKKFKAATFTTFFFTKVGSFWVPISTPGSIWTSLSNLD